MMHQMTRLAFHLKIDNEDDDLRDGSLEAVQITVDLLRSLRRKV